MNTGGIHVRDILEKFPSAKPLGEGGQKVVFTITDPTFGLCVLKIGFYSSDKALERIRREVRILRELESPYFPAQLAFTLVDSSRYYIIEELLQGQTLDESYSTFIGEPAVCTLAEHLLQGLDTLWARRIVHRDLKPQNIVICSGKPRIIDLGIARLLDAESLTQTYAPYGPCTPFYAAPEQLENRKRDIDPRTDQFALGIVLSQVLLYGQHPFGPDLVGGDSIPDNILRARWAHDQLEASTSPPMFEFVRRLLGREPYMRFRLPEDAMAALSAIVGPKP